MTLFDWADKHSIAFPVLAMFGMFLLLLLSGQLVGLLGLVTRAIAGKRLGCEACVDDE